MLVSQEPPSSSYVVQAGDTLWGIAGRLFGEGDMWVSIYDENRSVIADPDLIFPGEQLSIGSAHSGEPVSTSSIVNDPPAVRSGFGGNLSCSGLESLWRSADGNPGSAFIAAEIAMAESGGQEYATGPAGERGYWQINPVNGSLSTYDPYGNARAAIVLSYNGENWDAWTTYLSGAYIGRC